MSISTCNAITARGGGGEEGGGREVDGDYFEVGHAMDFAWQELRAAHSSSDPVTSNAYL